MGGMETDGTRGLTVLCLIELQGFVGLYISEIRGEWILIWGSKNASASTLGLLTFVPLCLFAKGVTPMACIPST